MNLENLFSGVTKPPSEPMQAESIDTLMAKNPSDHLGSGVFSQGQTPSAPNQQQHEVRNEPSDFLPSQTWNQPYQDLSEASVGPMAEATELSAPETMGSGQLDFLDAFPYEEGNGWDFSNAENLDLGFGMQLGLGGGRHDWNEAVSSDLLDGFFFGGTGSNMNGS